MPIIPVGKKQKYPLEKLICKITSVGKPPLFEKNQIKPSPFMKNLDCRPLFITINRNVWQQLQKIPS